MIMRQRQKILLGIGLSAGLFFVLVLVAIRIGGQQYASVLNTVAPTLAPLPATRERRRITRVQVVTQEGTCVTMTPDGVVVQSLSCEEESVQSTRLADPKFLFQLFKQLESVDTSLLTVPPKGAYITVTITTDQGQQTIYIPEDSDIGETIENVEEDLPSLTPTPTIPAGVTPSIVPSPSVTGSLAPTNPQSSTTPVPNTDPSDSGFSCDFTEGGVTKPYTISNYICSTGPTPNP